MKMRWCAGALAFCVLAGCGGMDANATGNQAATAEPASETAASAGDECVLGTYSMVEGGFTRSFTFNADRSGQEVQSASDIRALMWELKDPQTIHISYPAQGDAVESQWDLGFDCAQQTVSWGGAKYVKS